MFFKLTIFSVLLISRIVCADHLQLLSRQKRIVGGNFTTVTQFPYLVLVRNGIHRCSGVIIDKKWVLTSGHCMQGAHELGTVSTDHGVRNSPPCCSQRVRISRAIIHPQFAGRRAGYDIALLELSKELKYYDHVLPIAFPKRKIPQIFKGTIIGWGSRADTGHAVFLPRYIQLNIGNKSMCQMAASFYNQFSSLPENTICSLPSKKRQGPCQGDSGGPLVRIMQGGRHELLALSTKSSRICGQPYTVTGLFTLVTSLHDWIRNITGLDGNDAGRVDEILRTHEPCRSTYVGLGPMPTSCPLFGIS